MISFSEVHQIVMHGTSFTSIRGGSYIVSATSQIMTNLELSSTVFNNIFNVAGYYFKFSVCYGITINGENSSDVKTKSSWIQVHSGLAQGEILIKNSSYRNISVVLDPYELGSLYFLQIEVQGRLSLDNSEYLLLQGNNFSSILVDKSQQGFIQNVFRSPVILLALNNATVNMSENNFDTISSLPDDNIIGISATDIIIQNCLLHNLTYYEQSGAIYLIFSTLSVLNTTFNENRKLNDGPGGLLTLATANPNEKQVMNFTGVNFTRNMAQEATLMYIQGSQFNLTVADSAFKDNSAISAGLILISDVNNSNVTFSNVIFQYSQVPQTTGVEYLYDILEITKVTSAFPIRVKFSSCTLEVNGSFSGYLFVIQDNVQVELSVYNLIYQSSLTADLTSNDVNYTNSTGLTSSFGILRADKVNASFDTLEVKDLTMKDTSLFALACSGTPAVSSSFFIMNSQFYSLTLQGDASSILRLEDKGPNENSLCGVYIFLDQTNFENISKLGAGPVIRSLTSNIKSITSDSEVLFVKSSSFKNITNVTKGGVYYGRRRLHGDTSIVFNNCSFEDIKDAENGAVFYIDDTLPISGSGGTTRRLSQAQSEVFSVSSSRFSSISAVKGGVYYSDYQNQGQSVIHFESNSFDDVTVSNRGGVIHVNDSTVTTTGNHFNNVSAGISGSIIYSQDASANNAEIDLVNTITPPIGDSVKSISYAPNYLNVEIDSLDPIIRENFTNNSFILRNLTSDSLKRTKFHFTLMHRDSHRSQVVIDESTKNTVKMNFSLLSNSIIFEQECPGGRCSVSTQDQVILPGLANSIIQVDATYRPLEYPFYTASQQFMIELRPCVPGELNNSISGTCDLCADNSFSFDPSDQKCTACPVGATCINGSQIILQEGHWRSAWNSTYVVPCNDSGTRCSGGAYQNCSEGFSGPVCLQCDTDNSYLADGPMRCLKCSSNKGSLIAIGALLLLALSSYQYFLVYTTYKENKKQYEEFIGTPNQESPVRPGAFMVILTTYTQISSVIKKLSVGYLGELFGVSGAVGNPNQNVYFSVSCLYALITPDPFSMLKFKTILFVISPVAKLLVAFPFLLVGAIKNRKTVSIKRNLLMKVGLTATMLIILEQPGIIGVLCDYLACVKLDPYDSRRYVSSSPNIQCDTDDYNSFRKLFIIPCVAIWGAVIPLTFLLILYKNKARLESSEMLRVVFGSLYNNYSSQAYFWGIITMFFKICIFVLDSVITLDEFGKAAIFLLVIHPYFFIFKYRDPHLSKDLHRAEKYAIMSFLWTLSFILLKTQVTGDAFSKVLDLLMTVANGVAIGYLLYKISFVYIKKALGVFSMIKEKLANRKKGKNKQIELERPQASQTENTASVLASKPAQFTLDDTMRAQLQFQN